MRGRASERGRPCPISGKIRVRCTSVWYRALVASDAFEDLIDHLKRTTPLGQGEARRVVAEILAYFSEDVAEFVRRRHAELRGRGLTNEEVFATVGAEIRERRFLAPQLSTRQLRRIIYG
jgi:hypothetical protein